MGPLTIRLIHPLPKASLTETDSPQKRKHGHHGAAELLGFLTATTDEPGGELEGAGHLEATRPPFEALHPHNLSTLTWALRA